MYQQLGYYLKQSDRVMSEFNLRSLRRYRRNREDHYLVAIDQSFSNYAMVLFKNGEPISRYVAHTGGNDTKKNKAKDEVLTNSRFFGTVLEQLDYLYGEVLAKIAEWNPSDIVFEGLSFGSSGNMERQLGALYFGIMVSLKRELGYEYDQLHTVTPKQCKSLAREFLLGDDRYERNKKTGEIVYLATKKPQLNKMTGKKFVMKALENTPYNWIVDGYTRDGLTKSRKVETGIEDLPDAFFIGLFIMEQKFNHKLQRT